MKLQPFRIEINRHEPFIGLFESSGAALEAFHALASAEARTLKASNWRYSPADLKENAMTRLNDKTTNLYRKVMISPGRFKQSIDQWAQRYPATTAVVLALPGLVLIWLAHREAI